MTTKLLRHTTIMAIALLTALVAWAAGSASEAQAVPAMIAPGCYALTADAAIPGYRCDQRISELSYYKGWAKVELECIGAATVIPNYYRPAWRWTSTGWKSASLRTETWVYVWPYATGWSWVWTQSTGWLAMQDRYLVVNETGCNYAPLGGGTRVP